MRWKIWKSLFDGIPSEFFPTQEERPNCYFYPGSPAALRKARASIAQDKAVHVMVYHDVLPGPCQVTDGVTFDSGG